MLNKNYRLPPIQLSEVILFANDGILGKDIQILKAGKFSLDEETLEVTPENLLSMVKNFQNKARGVDIMLDYSHDSGGKAAAWFTDIRAQNDDTELWGTVEWTETGAMSVKRREFRYISADFTFQYEDNETLEEFGPTLFGAALTNRPVVKRMVPTVLSENINTLSKEDQMTIEELTKKNAELQTKLDEMGAELTSVKAACDKFELAEKEAKEQVKLAEEKVKKDNLLAEKKSKFDKKLSEGAVCEAQREAYMTDNLEEFTDKAAPVKLDMQGDNGNGGEQTNSKTPAQDEVMKLAEVKIKELKISLSEGIKKVLSENEELNKKYLKETNV